MTVSAVFSRALVGSGLPDLTVTDYPAVGGYWFPEDDVTEPEFDERTTFADDSPHDSGSQPTQSVRGLGTLAMVVYTRADSEANLKAQKRALEDTVRQFTYTCALTIVGSADTYTCLPGKVSWGQVDSGMVRGLLARCVITIPVQPLGA